MKKVIVLLFVLGLSGSLFASLQKTATAGQITNELDNIADPLYLNGVDDNVINFGTHSLGNLLNSSTASFLFNLGLVELPGGIRLGISVDNTESWNDPLDTTAQTNIAIAGVADANITQTVTSRKNNTDSSSRNMTFVLAPGGSDFTAGLLYNYTQSGTVIRGTYNIAAGSLGAIADNTLTEFKVTNDDKVSSRTTIALGDGYNDGVSITHTFTPAFKIGDFSIYAPIIISSFGTAQKAIETNITETPTNAVTEVSHTYESYIKNGKTTLIKLTPSVTLTLENILHNLSVTAGFTFGMGFAPVSNSVYILDSETGKNTAVTNNTATRNTTAWNGFSYVPMGVTGGLTWSKQATEKIKIVTGVKVTYTVILSGYESVVQDSTSVTTNDVYSYRTSSITTKQISSFSSAFSTIIPFGIQWMVFDWLGINLGTELSYSSTYGSSKTITQTPSYFSDNGGATNQSLVSSGQAPYAPLKITDSGSSSTATTFHSGFTWQLAKQLYLDGSLGAAIADTTLIGGANRFIFGAFFDQFTSTANWNLELRLLF